MTLGNERVTASVPPGRVRKAAALSWSWLLRNLDAGVALVVAVLIAILDQIKELKPTSRDDAVIVVLGLLAFGAIRDRERGESRDRAAAAASEQIRQSTEQMRADLAAIGHAMAAQAQVRILHTEEAGHELAVARDNARTWLFRGGTGTDFRQATLPRIVPRAQSHSLSVGVEILDPTDSDACDRYAEHRDAQDGGVQSWDRNQVKRECYATILACCWYRQRYPRLQLELRLSRIVRTMLWDISDEALFITQEDPLRPVLKAPADCVLYDYVRTELDYSFDHARQVDLAPARSVHLSVEDRPSHHEVRRLFLALGLPIPSGYLDTDLADIIDLALPAENGGP